MEPLAELRKQVQGSKVVTGTSEVIKLLKGGKIAKVFMASNCPDNVKESLKHYSSICGCEFVELAVPNDELGVICKQPFSIAVVGVPK